MKPRYCPKCNKVMMELIPTSAPQKGDWYCEDCHYSAPMTDYRKGVGEPDVVHQALTAMEINNLGKSREAIETAKKKASFKPGGFKEAE